MNRGGKEKVCGKLWKKESGGGDTQEEWRGIKDKIRATLKEVGREQRKSKRIRQKGWWNEECRIRKEKVKEKLKKWRDEGGDGMDYGRKN